jgi:hypothetical protein
VVAWIIISVCAALPGEDEAPSASEPAPQPSDLTVLNLFSEGWDQAWIQRPRQGRAPDMALLKVTTNFLERELRVDYAYTHAVKQNPRARDIHFLNGLLTYPLNRRFMLEVITNYQWDRSSAGPDVDGPGGGFLGRLQLVDTYSSSCDFQVRVAAPNKAIGQTQTSLAPAAAGFQDLQVLLGLDRVGLYYSLQYQNLAGPHKPGAKESDLSYDLSVARTWTEPGTFLLGNLTTFGEIFATTDLDGDRSGHTLFTATPGVRFWPARKNSLTFGADLPLNRPHPFSEVFRVSYILNF